MSCPMYIPGQEGSSGEEKEVQVQVHPTGGVSSRESVRTAVSERGHRWDMSEIPACLHTGCWILSVYRSLVHAHTIIHNINILFWFYACIRRHGRRSRFVQSKHSLVGYFTDSSSVSGVSTNDASDEESSDDEGAYYSLKSEWSGSACTGAPLQVIHLPLMIHFLHGNMLKNIKIVKGLYSIISLHTAKEFCVHPTSITWMMPQCPNVTIHGVLSNWFAAFVFSRVTRQ